MCIPPGPWVQPEGGCWSHSALLSLTQRGSQSPSFAGAPALGPDLLASGHQGLIPNWVTSLMQDHRVLVTRRLKVYGRLTVRNSDTIHGQLKTRDPCPQTTTNFNLVTVHTQAQLSTRVTDTSTKLTLPLGDSKGRLREGQGSRTQGCHQRY